MPKDPRKKETGRGNRIVKTEEYVIRKDTWTDGEIRWICLYIDGKHHRTFIPKDQKGDG